MEFVFIFAIVFFQMLFINLLKVMEIVRALGINAFMDNKVFTVFLVNKWMRAVRAFQNRGFWKTAVVRSWKTILAYLAKKLAFLFAIIPHKILERCAAKITAAVLRNVTFATAKDRFDGFVIALFIVGNEVGPFPILFEGYDFRKLINFKLLIFWRMGIIESPLFERDVSADKV